jgi:hypothetical protein
VYGLATTGGTGVVASSAVDETGLALNAIGPTQFSLSGLASIAAGAKSKAITGVSLRSTSLVLATVQNNAGVSVAYVVPNVSGSKITINLDKVRALGEDREGGLVRGELATNRSFSSTVGQPFGPSVTSR